MVRWPNCGELVSVSKKVCTKCGNPINLSNSAIGEKKKPSVFVFAAVFLSVMLITALGVYFLLGAMFGPPEPPEPHEIKVIIDYDKPWSGAYSLSTGVSESIDGSGYKEYGCTLYDDDIISINAQKQDDSQDALRMDLYQDEELVKTGSTTSAYGIVQLSYTVG